MGNLKSKHENKPKGQTIKTAKLAIASLVISILALISLQASFVMVGLENSLPIWLKTYIPDRVPITLITAPMVMSPILGLSGVILGIIALIWIKKTKGQLTGKRVAVGGLVIGLAVVLFEIAGVVYAALCFALTKT